MLEVTNNYAHSNDLLEHVFKGEIRSDGSPSGFHCNRNLGDENAEVVLETRANISDLILTYQVRSIVTGRLKKGNGGYSSFFKESLNRQEILDILDRATPIDENGVYLDMRTGLMIQTFTDSYGNFKTFYPIVLD